VSDILDEVKRRFGISFSETHTGGGCCALEARLESGHWIVATDEGLCGFKHRQEFEADPDHANLGWSIGIYEDQGGDEGWFGAEDSIVDVIWLEARAENLPHMVAKALRELAGVANRNATKKGTQ
jgi:hypothetical protein